MKSWWLSLVMAISVLVLPRSGQAQNVWQYKSESQLDLNNLVVGKYSDAFDQQGMEFLIPQWQFEERTGEYTVTMFVVETRTRTVNGFEETYTVQIPVTETRTRTYTVRLPLKPKRMAFPLSSVSVWTAKGENLNATSIAGAFKQPRQAFLIETPIYEPDPFVSQMLAQNSLVVFINGLTDDDAQHFNGPIPPAPQVDPLAPEEAPPAPIVEP